VDHDELLEMTM